ncbi:MAG: phage tail sheath family protein [Saprospiraceae bacterium]|nr:phage tail sheath family protein [Saprospiraceae bacterium]
MSNLSTLKTPGVYIDEVSLLPPSVVGVGTSIPAFVGYTQKGGPAAADDPIAARKIFSLKEYEDAYGTADAPPSMTVKVTEVRDADGKTLKRDIEAGVGTENQNNHIMYYAIQHYFANGGGPCYIVSVGKTGSTGPASGQLKKGVQTCMSEDEPTMIVVPEAIYSGDNYVQDVYQTALEQAETLKDRVVIMDVRQAAAKIGDIGADLSAFRAPLSENLAYGAAYYPTLKTTISYKESADDQIVLQHKDATGANLSLNGQTMAAIKAENGALYASIKQKTNRVGVVLPPSAAVAGIYVQTDQSRGVWKAPANVGVSAAIGPTIKFDNLIQDDMNVPDDGKAVNAIRTITGRGEAIVWGARTMDGNSNEWRYVNVRRFFNFVEESVKKATQRFVFEPNDANTWVKIRAMIENFLILQWRAGALMGSKPEQAFFVRVGLGQTMTADDVLNGRLIVEIGMAAVRPAEFIVLSFMHKMPE